MKLFNTKWKRKWECYREIIEDNGYDGYLEYEKKCLLDITNALQTIVKQSKDRLIVLNEITYLMI